MGLYPETIDWKTGIEWNQTYSVAPGLNLAHAGESFQTSIGSGGVILLWASYGADYGNVTTEENPITYYGINAETGDLMWKKDIMNLPGFPSIGTFGGAGDGVFTVHKLATQEWYGYDVRTGDLLWGPVCTYKNDWDSFSASVIGTFAYGKFFPGGIWADTLSVLM